MTVEQFTEIYKWVISTIIAGIAAEGVAEKWNAPPPPVVRAADSLKPPPKPPADLPYLGGDE